MSDYTHWHVGMKVVCIRDAGPETKFGVEIIPVRGEVYTIRTIEASNEGICIRLAEIINPVLPYDDGLVECDFHSEGFRPVQTRATDISCFTAMLVNPPKELAYTVPNRPFE